MSLHKKISNVKQKSLTGNGSAENASLNKVDSAIAKYDQDGNLTCIVCKSVIKSSNLWKVHINSKQHKLRLEKATRGQLINKTTSETAPKPPISKDKPKELIIVTPKEIENPIRISSIIPEKCDTAKNTEVLTSLPDKFFDDPSNDAKQRKEVVKDQNNEEWARFQKEIKEVSLMSSAIISEEQDDEALKQQLLDIDGQIDKLSKVIELSKKSKTGWRKEHSTKKTNIVDDVEQLSDEDLDWTELGDWRVKRIKRIKI